MSNSLENRCPNCVGHRESGTWLCSTYHAKHLAAFEARRKQWRKKDCGNWVDWRLLVKTSKEQAKAATIIRLHKEITGEEDYIPSRNYGNWKPFYRLEDTSPRQDNAIRILEDMD